MLIKISIFSLMLFATQSGLYATPPETHLLELYKAEMKKYPPADIPISHCLAPEILENRHSRRYRTAFTNQFKESAPTVNFCGKYFAFITPTTGGGDLFLADCSNGKVTTHREVDASFGPLTHPNSCLLIEWAPRPEDTYKTYEPTAFGPPRLYRYNGSKLINIKDPVWPKK